MKKRLTGYLLGGIVVLIVGWFIINPYEVVPVPLGESVYPGPDESWAPNRTEIARTLQAACFTDETEKLRAFSDLFKKRYREQSLPFYCRLVEQDGQPLFRLFCTGAMPRWYTARVARSLWEEIRYHTGRTVPVLIYESSIFQDPRYIGKCYVLESGKDIEVRFIEWSTDRIPRSASPKSGTADPSVNRNGGIFRLPVKSGFQSRF